MKVSELIVALQEMPRDREVAFWAEWDDERPITDVIRGDPFVLLGDDMPAEVHADEGRFEQGC